jgi:RNA polymerase sigma-70 factor (ECF subfamily)
VDREQILASLRERIVAFAASRIARDVAEDLAQEVLVLLHEKYSHVTRLEELLPLSFQIVRFKMVSLRRKAARRGEYTQVSVEDIQLPDLGSDPVARLERKQMSERLAAAISRLDGRCRDLFRLKLEGKTFAEIQAVLGANSINTIYTWDARCRKRLLELMGGSWESGHVGEPS